MQHHVLHYLISDGIQSVLVTAAVINLSIAGAAHQCYQASQLPSQRGVIQQLAAK